MTGNQAYFPPERPEIDACVFCGLEGWACICNPLKPRLAVDAAELERARDERLTRAERLSGRDGR